MTCVVPLDLFENIKNIRSVKVIGHITEHGSGNYLVADNGTEIEIEAQGWKK
ncbi:MAG: hypothetical protein MUC93_12385 [Bacteroidales bacterium]|jgi:thiamine-monophosphate kinase|nr:hypothetical protein [Bacteroidales bacterium]